MTIIPDRRVMLDNAVLTPRLVASDIQDRNFFSEQGDDSTFPRNLEVVEKWYTSRATLPAAKQNKDYFDSIISTRLNLQSSFKAARLGRSPRNAQTLFYALRLWKKAPSKISFAKRQVIQARTLPFDGDFVPSSKLLGIWVSGIESYLSEAFPDEPRLARVNHIRSDTRALSKEFSIILYHTISLYATMKRYQVSRFTVCIDRRMAVSLQTQILNELYIRPDDGTNFFALLVSEMIAFLALGNKFKGDWGELILEGGGDLSLILNKPRKKRTKGFTPSDED